MLYSFTNFFDSRLKLRDIAPSQFNKACIALYRTTVVPGPFIAAESLVFNIIIAAQEKGAESN